jgi:hypothetical protein
MAEVTEQQVQDWFDSGPVKPNALDMWLKIIQENKDK